jgi:hypothetical protein
MQRTTVVPLPAPLYMPGGSGQMPAVATIKDFKDLPKIMGPALVKAEPESPKAAEPEASGTVAPVVKPEEDFGFVPDKLVAAKTAPIASKTDDDFGFCCGPEVVLSINSRLDTQRPLD